MGFHLFIQARCCSSGAAHPQRHPEFGTTHPRELWRNLATGIYHSGERVGLWRDTKRTRRLSNTGKQSGKPVFHQWGYTRYGAAKAAQDLGPFGITVNCIAPGLIATGRIMATIIPGSVQSTRDRAELVALRRLGTVEDCAKVVEFLATDLSDYVTGAVIPIDGGLVRG